MIRDTSATDRRIEAPVSHKRWIVIGAVGAVVLAALVWVVPTVARLVSAGSAVSANSVRIGTVKRGTLTRDISAQGKVVASVYSPELNNKLEQEQATFNSLSIEVERTGIDNKQKQLTAKRTIDQAAIDRQTAAREVDRNERGYKGGAIPEINVLRAKDALEKADLDVEHAQADAKLMDETLAFELKTKHYALEKQKLLVGELTRQVDQLKVRSPVTGQ